MIKYKGLLLTLAFAVASFSAQAATTQTPITFYNNTNIAVQVNTYGYAGDLLLCPNLCIQQFYPLSIAPHKSGVIYLKSTVSDPHVYYGGITFQVQNQDGTRISQIEVPVQADPSGAYVDNMTTDRKGNYYLPNSQTQADYSLPKYTASLVEEGQGVEMQQTVVSINPVQLSS